MQIANGINYTVTQTTTVSQQMTKQFGVVYIGIIKKSYCACAFFDTLYFYLILIHALHGTKRSSSAQAWDQLHLIM